MVIKTCVAVFSLLLAVLLASCGGGGSSQSLLNPDSQLGVDSTIIPGGSNGQDAPLIQPTEWEMGDLPGTIPAAPKDLASVIAESTLNADRATSAVLTTVTTGSASTVSPVGGGASHDYVLSDGMVWAEAQDTSVETEYHIHGTVTGLNLEAGGVSYATIGLVDFFTFNYAINGAPNAPQSQYLFNQNVYLMIRRDAAGIYWVRLGDYNGRWGSHETSVTMPFNFDLMIQPTNPILSIPGGAPYTSHDVGLATLSINGAVLGSSVTYGNNNWGWFRSLAPELFNMPNGGAMLIGQVYASGDSIGSSLNFDATLESGPLATVDPTDWWCYGQNRTNHRLSTFDGPQTGNRLWTFTGFGGATDSPPVIGSDGTIYTGCADGNLYAIDPDGTLKWTSPAPGLGVFSSPAVGNSGAIYAVARNLGSISSFSDNGATGSLNWTLGLGGVVSQHPALGHNGIIYIVLDGGILYAIRDNGATATIMWSLPFPPGITLNAPAIADDGTIYITNGIGTIFSIRDNGGSGTFLSSYNPGGGTPRCSPVIAPDGTIYIAGSPNVTALTHDGVGFNLKWSVATGILNLRGGMALGPTGRLYVHDTNGILVSITDNGATGSIDWNFNTGSEYGSITVSNDGTIYLAGNLAPHAGEYIALVDNGGSASLLWSDFVGGFMGYGASPIMVADGRLIASSSNGTLIAYEDSGPFIPVTIDSTSLSDASFFLHRPDDTVISGPHDTDLVYDASGDVSTGDQFYLSFALDGAASPNDLLIYPDIPATGLVNVNAGNLAFDLAIAPYYTNPVGTRTLTLNPGAYNRVTNDLTSLGHALYSLRDSGSGSSFGGPFDTDASAIDQVILRDGTTYRPVFSADAYPTAGSNAAFNGSAETIYPTEWSAGNLYINGDMPGGGAAPLITEQGTVLGDYFTQVGLINTLDVDAFCRFDCDMTAVSLNYGFWDVTGATWIVPILPGLDNAADPWNTAVFARGTTFQVRNASPGGQSPDIDVDPGQLLDGATSITRSLGFSGPVTLNVLPVRVWDDPALSDPSANITWVGTGWDVSVDFLLQYGQGPYTVELDADFGSTWDDGTAGRVYTLSGSQYAATGLLNGTVSILMATQPAGNYSYAIRVTDSNADEYTYVWPDTVALNLPSGWNKAVPSLATTDDVGLHTSMAIINGYPAVAFYNFTDGDLMYVRATDAFGSFWEAPIVVDTINDAGRYCSLADIGGNPAISYWEGLNGYLMYARAADADGTDWAGVGSINEIADQDPPPPFNGSGVGQFSSLAEVNGKPAISYYSATFGALEYARSHDSLGADWSGVTAIDILVHNPGSGSAGWDTSLAVINGNPAISYHRRTGGASGELWYARSDDADGSNWLGGSTIRVRVDDGGPTPGGPVGEYTSLAEVNGRPAISYYIAKAFGDVRYARAGDATGSVWSTFRTVHAGGGTDNIGMFTSLAVIGGIPAVSYYHATNGDLMYCLAGDASGTSWGTNDIVDSVGFTGGYTSMLEIGGDAAISYYDFTDGDLEYSKHWP